MHQIGNIVEDAVDEDTLAFRVIHQIVSSINSKLKRIVVLRLILF